MKSSPRAAVDAKFQRWGADRDGQRFLLNVPVENATPQSAQIVLNWAATLSQQ